MNASTNRAPELIPGNWRVWRHTKTCELWEGVFLSMDLEPEQFRPMFFHWMRATDRRTPLQEINHEFCDRLAVALANVGWQSLIVPKQPRLDTYQHPRVKVAVANVADFFNGMSKDFPVPEEFKALARGDASPSASQGANSTLKRSALIGKYKHLWRTLERDLRDSYRNGLSHAAKAPPHGMWLEVNALGWAVENHKLRQRPELPVMFN